MVIKRKCFQFRAHHYKLRIAKAVNLFLQKVAINIFSIKGKHTGGNIFQAAVLTLSEVRPQISHLPTGPVLCLLAVVLIQASCEPIIALIQLRCAILPTIWGREPSVRSPILPYFLVCQLKIQYVPVSSMSNAVCQKYQDALLHPHTFCIVQNPNYFWGVTNNNLSSVRNFISIELQKKTYDSENVTIVNIIILQRPE